MAALHPVFSVLGFLAGSTSVVVLALGATVSLLASHRRPTAGERTA